MGALEASKIYQNLVENGAQTVPEAIWKDSEGSGGQNGSSGSVSSRWRVQERPREPEMDAK